MPPPSLWGALTLFLALGLLGVATGYLVKVRPLISGSGIPHVELVLRGQAPMPWATVLTSKFVGTQLSLIGGLSVGREGPSIQMGGAVGYGMGLLWHRQPDRLPYYLVGGSVGGLTAAFGAPLAGMLFAFEELKCRAWTPFVFFTASCALSAWVMVRGLFSLGLVFPFSDIMSLRLSQAWLCVLAGIGLGCAGSLYNFCLLSFTRLCDRQRLLGPVLKPVPAFLAVGFFYYCYPDVLTGFGVSLDELARIPRPLAAVLLLLGVKILFSIGSFASGVPGGLLMPMLVIGALCGVAFGNAALSAALAEPEQLAAFMVVCMAGMFAATVRAPLTGAALVIEMSGAYHCLLYALLVAWAASFTANRLHSIPVYDALKERMLASLEGRGGVQTAPRFP